MKIDNLKLSPTADEKEVFSLALKKSGLKRSQIKSYRILKKSIDARDKNNIKIVYSVEISDTVEKSEIINTILGNPEEAARILTSYIKI